MQFNLILGNRDGAVVRVLASHCCGLGLIPEPRVTCGLSLLLVIASAPRYLFPAPWVFFPSQKTTF